MTRGKFIWIENESGDCLYTDEFNGDMGVDQSNGKLAMRKLSTCKSRERFLEISFEFLKKYGYELQDADCGIYVDKCNIVDTDFNNEEDATGTGGYFNNWFSDYIYVVNPTSKDIVIKDFDGADTSISANAVNVFDFGKKIVATPISENEDFGQDEEAGEDSSAMSLKDAVSRNAIEFRNDFDTITLLTSIKNVLESGVDRLRLKISDSTGKVVVDENCYKGIGCGCVRIAQISDRGHFSSKDEAKLHIETSQWHFPCPDYKYSNIKRNLEVAIQELTGICKVEVKSFSTGIIDYDE